MGKNTIYVGPADGSNRKPLQTEGTALSAVRPGALCELAATGIDENDNAGTVFGTEPLFANIDSMRSRTPSDNWTINENMSAIRLRSGDFANVLVAAGNNITARGVGLASNGDGTLKIAATDGTEEVIVYSNEIINVTGSAALVQVYAK